MKNLFQGATIILASLAPLAFMGCGTRSAAATQSSVRAVIQAQRLGTCEIKSSGDSLKPDGLRLINVYNARNFGSPGFRRVTLELVSNGEVTRTLKVINLWKRQKSEVRTLFFLEEPQGLSGTNYLLIERKTEMPDMKVHLFLPAGRRQVLEIKPSNFDEGLLGSDFTYSDLRMQLPAKGYKYTVVGQTSLLGVSAWAVEAEPLTEAMRQTSPWALARYYLARDFQFLLGADYYSNSQDKNGPPRLARRMRVQSLKQIDGVWTATRMAMFSADNCSSVLTLKDARFALANLDSNFFSPEQLPLLEERIRGRW